MTLSCVWRKAAEEPPTIPLQRRYLIRDGVTCWRRRLSGRLCILAATCPLGANEGSHIGRDGSEALTPACASHTRAVSPAYEHANEAEFFPCRLMSKLLPSFFSLIISPSLLVCSRLSLSSLFVFLVLSPPASSVLPLRPLLSSSSSFVLLSYFSSPHFSSFLSLSFYRHFFT